LGFVSLEYNAQGINNNYCNSGVSSIQAITAGMHAIREGYADLVFAGGYDSIIGEEGLLGYGRLGLLATEQEGVSPQTAHRPFGAARTGLIPGEGACFVMLESTAHAQARGAQPMAQLLGGGVCSGAYGITDPDPAGTKLRLALAEASRDARVSLDSVEALFAHGAGSVTFDPIEVQVYREAMGAQAAQRVLATADKGQVGHTMCAAGAISTGLAVQALASGRVPAMGGTQTVDRACAGLDWVLEESREATVGRALVSSAGLGGQAAALLLDRA
ncbi:MAG: beta-ketoacyl synthase N-terminal-like domain-containing protein, partial [Myxococcota bacterium]